MENDILDSLNDLGYQGPLNDEVGFAKALEGGPKSLEFTKLIHILAEELRKLCHLEEAVSVMNNPDESSSFLLELSSFLKELGCPYKCLVTGHMSSRLQSKEDRLLLLDYMISELMAARMVQIDCPKEKKSSSMEIVMQESPTAKDLKEILIALKFNKPPPNITPEMLFSKLEAKLKDTLQKEGDNLVGKPIYNKAISEKDWKNLECSYSEMYEEYRLRRETLITRLECTIQSFEWSDRLKSKKDAIQSVYRPKRSALMVKPDVKLADFLAARSTLLHVEKTSSASVRKNTQSDVNKVIIGQVPDRGGRPNEQQPPPPEMPSWQQRSAPQGGGGRGGGDGGRGGRGGARGGRGGGGGGGGRVQGGYSQATGQEQASGMTSSTGDRQPTVEAKTQEWPYMGLLGAKPAAPAPLEPLAREGTEVSKPVEDWMEAPASEWEALTDYELAILNDENLVFPRPVLDTQLSSPKSPQICEKSSDAVLETDRHFEPSNLDVGNLPKPPINKKESELEKRLRLEAEKLNKRVYIMPKNIIDVANSTPKLANPVPTLTSVQQVSKKLSKKQRKRLRLEAEKIARENAEKEAQKSGVKLITPVNVANTVPNLEICVSKQADSKKPKNSFTKPMKKAVLDDPVKPIPVTKKIMNKSEMNKMRKRLLGLAAKQCNERAHTFSPVEQVGKPDVFVVPMADTGFAKGVDPITNPQSEITAPKTEHLPIVEGTSQGTKRSLSFEQELPPKKIRLENPTVTKPIYNNSDLNPRKDCWWLISDKSGVPMDKNRAALLQKALENAQYDLYERNQLTSIKLLPIFRFQPELKNGKLCLATRDEFSFNWVTITVGALHSLWEGCIGFTVTSGRIFHTGIFTLPGFLKKNPEKTKDFLSTINPYLKMGLWPIYGHRVKITADGYDHIFVMGIPSKNLEMLKRSYFRLNYKLSSVVVNVTECRSYTEVHAENIEKMLNEYEEINKQDRIRAEVSHNVFSDQRTLDITKATKDNEITVLPETRDASGVKETAQGTKRGLNTKELSSKKARVENTPVTEQQYPSKERWVFISDINGVPMEADRAALLQKALEIDQYRLYHRYKLDRVKKPPMPIFKFQPELLNGKLCLAAQNEFSFNWLTYTASALHSLWKGCCGFAVTSAPIYHTGIFSLPDFCDENPEESKKFLSALNPHLDMEGWPIYAQRVTQTSEGYNHILAMGVPPKYFNILKRENFRLTYKLSSIVGCIRECRSFTDMDLGNIENILTEYEKLNRKGVVGEWNAIGDPEVSSD